jgi:Fe-S-cluster containining protein
MIVIPSFVPSEVCLRCQGCCRFSEARSSWSPNLTKEERQAFPGTGYKLALEARGDGFICSQFDPGSSECRRYAERPLECRLYPFVVHRKAGLAYLAVDRNCPFVEESYSSPFFSGILDAYRALCGSEEFRSLVRDNPQIVQDYGDVEIVSPIGI